MDQPHRIPAHPDAGYLYFRNFLAARSAGISRDELRDRVERLFHDLCKQVAPTLSLEIGAHEARFSRWVKQHSPETRCLAFEANPYVYEQHAGRLQQAGVEYLHLAVGPTNGTVELGIPTSVREKSRKLTNRMASLGRHTQAESVHMVEVESVRLDDFVAVDLDDRIVAWIDVEGASAMVLQSGREVLARTALVYIEVEQEARWEDQWLDVDVAQFFADLGFVPIARDTQRHNQYNVIFARADLAVDPKVARLAARRYRDVVSRKDNG